MTASTASESILRKLLPKWVKEERVQEMCAREAQRLHDEWQKTVGHKISGQYDELRRDVDDLMEWRQSHNVDPT